MDKKKKQAIKTRLIKVNYGESEINLDIWWGMAPLAPNAETSLLPLISLIFLFSARPNPDTGLRLHFPTQLKPFAEEMSSLHAVC